MLHFAYLRAAGARGKNFIRSYRKERKSSLGCFSGQINSKKIFGGLERHELSVTTCTKAHTLGSLSSRVCSSLSKAREQPNSYCSQDEKIEDFRNASTAS